MNTNVHIRRLLRDIENLPSDERTIPTDYPQIHVPKHLQSFAKSQVKDWIDSAILALFHYQEK